MADQAEAEAMSSGTKIEDVHPEDFVLSDFIQEIATLITERQAFLDSKVERRTIGKEEQNLALFRLIRMRALHHYLKRIEAHQLNKPVDEIMPAPPIESPLKDFVEEIEAQVEEISAPADEVVHPEPAPLPDKAPKVEEFDDWD